jgi:hypothetical protein
LRRTAYATAIITFASHEANAPILTPHIPAMIAAAMMALIATQTPQRVRSLRRSPAKHIDLLPQDQVFRFQRCSRLEARSQDTENQLEQIGHQDASLRRPLAASTPNRIFGTHRPELERVAIGLLERLMPLPKAVRLLGVSLSALQRKEIGASQLALLL